MNLASENVTTEKMAIDKKDIKNMKVSLFGLGYVGAVTAACLADEGFQVIGVDVNQSKVDLLNDGKSPIIEERISDVVANAVKTGKLRSTSDISASIAETDVSLICVGTPSRANGDLELDYVKRVSEQIGSELANKDSYHTIILRSTVLPGTTEEVVLPILEKSSGKKVGEEFGLCFNPEFLREGSSVKDFYEPPFTLVGVRKESDAEAVRALYGWLDTEFIVVDIKTAEMIKYINNSYHGLKVAFANEVGRLSAALGVDSHTVMEIFCKDTKQNLSSYYMKPGYSFGGSCLPKDLRAILYKAKTLDVPMEVFASILPSNQTQTQLGIKMIEDAGSKNVGLLGLSFKAGTDDLRESPLVALVESLLGKGYNIKIYDSNVALARLVGANKTYIEKGIPHIAELLTDSLEEVVKVSDTIVIGNPADEFRDALGSMPAEKTVIDLVRIVADLKATPEGYKGIGW